MSNPLPQRDNKLAGPFFSTPSSTPFHQPLPTTSIPLQQPPITSQPQQQNVNNAPVSYFLKPSTPPPPSQQPPLTNWTQLTPSPQPLFSQSAPLAPQQLVPSSEKTWSEPLIDKSESVNIFDKLAVMLAESQSASSYHTQHHADETWK
jgi:hypothetical protein